MACWRRGEADLHPPDWHRSAPFALPFGPRNDTRPSRGDPYPLILRNEANFFVHSAMGKILPCNCFRRHLRGWINWLRLSGLASFWGFPATSARRFQRLEGGGWAYLGATNNGWTVVGSPESIRGYNPVAL